MKRKTSTLPTRIYRFGCFAPVEGAELVDGQMRAARVYRNKLIEIELARRTAVRAAQTSVGDIAALHAKADRLAKEREEIRLAIKSARKAARGRVAVDATATARLKELSSELAGARAELKTARAALKQRPEILAAYRAADEAANVAVKAARAASGLYWGTYLLVERAHEQVRSSKTDPQFRRWDGSGRVGVQLQGGRAMEKLTLDTRLRIEALPTTGSRREQKRTRVHLRIGTGPDGRSPIWAVFPLILHRTPPAGAIIKWAWVARERIGPDWRWSLCLSVEAAFPKRECGAGVVALDVGWRQRPGGGLRVGYWHDDQGQEGEIVLPPELVSRLPHADSVREIRDREFNAVRVRLLKWLASPTQTPAWLQDALKNCGQWRSCARLAQVVTRWTGERFDGDAEIFAALEAWRKQDRHLWTWEANQRDKAYARRRDLYRVVAADLAKRYHTIVLERFDLREVAKRKQPESKDTEMPAPVRHQRAIVAISELRQCLAERLKVEEVDAAGTSTECSGCKMPLPTGEDLMVACPGCGIVWDQDQNAARVIMARWASGSVTSGSPAPLAEGDDGRPSGFGGEERTSSSGDMRRHPAAT
jgi:hypothetical protein